MESLQIVSINPRSSEYYDTIREGPSNDRKREEPTDAD